MKSYDDYWDQNQLTKAVIDLFQKLLIFGFYQDPDELGGSKILENLLKLFTSCLDVTSKKEDIYVKSIEYEEVDSSIIQPNMEHNMKEI